MAIVKDGIMGPFRNKVGTVIGRGFRGLEVMTGLYEQHSEHIPSEAQLQQRSRFAMLSTLLSAIDDLVNRGFKKLVKRGQSPVNAAFKYNFPHAFRESDDPFQFNYPKIVYSRGPVARANCPSVSLPLPGTLRFSWLPQQEHTNNRYQDKASFLIYDVEKKKAIVLIDKAIRGDLQFDFELHEKLQGDTFHCYMSFCNEAGKLVSDSVYVDVVGS